MENKSLFYRLAETYEAYRAERTAKPTIPSRRASTWFARQLMPNLGSVLLVLVLLTVFPGLAAPFNGINAASISTIPYQGRLADASGNPVTGKQNMEFRIYDVPTGGTPLWEEFWTGANSVDVSDGLFSVMLGSINTNLTSVVQNHSNLYLDITVGTDDPMTPRVQLGSVPFSIWSLTVADNSITTAKIVDGAITTAKLDIDSGLDVTGDISLTGVLQGSNSYWADYRSFIRFLHHDGVTTEGLCPEGGIPVGVTGPKQSLELLTGNDICQYNYDTTRTTCINVHQIAPCGSIIGNFFPYSAQPCSQDFSGKWAPFLWGDGNTSHAVTSNILGAGIGCFEIKYACCGN